MNLSLPLLLAGAALAAEPSLELTIYNDDLALVKDRRILELPKGRSGFAWDGVAQTLIPSSASFSSPSAKALEQNYRYDLVSRGVLLQKYLGLEVTLVQEGNAPGAAPVETKGRVLSVEGDRITSLDAGGRILLDPPGRVVLPSLPEGLLVKPSLVLDLWASSEAKSEAQLRYLCSGLSWSADYIAVLDSADRQLDLDGLVTLNNRSGTAFRDARLKLVAGAVNRIPESTPRAYRGNAAPMLAKSMLADGLLGEAAEPGGFEEQGLFEYHLYELGRPASVLDNEQKQVSLLSAKGAAVRKRFVFDESLGSRYWWWNRESDTKEGRKLAVVVDVPNLEKNHLGMPLPKGKVRVYKADRSGSLQFVGEDRIEHTAKEDTLHLALGQAFDLFGKRVVESSSTVKEERTETVAVTLHNSKDEAVEVEVVEHQAWPRWNVKSASGAYRKKDASTLVFPVKVPAHGEATVRYVYQASWK